MGEDDRKKKKMMTKLNMCGIIKKRKGKILFTKSLIIPDDKKYHG